MTPDYGRLALTLAMALAGIQVVAGLQALTGGATAAMIARRAAIAAAAAIVVAFAVLIVAFARSDFSVAIVASHSHTLKPLIYKLAAAWGNHEGSLLLWCLVLTASAAAFAHASSSADILRQRALVILGMLSIAFIGFALFASDPFERLSPTPVEGAGFNPLLQDPALAAHPPMLYLGYVGLAIPFALAIAALWEGAAGREWARSMRTWTLASFCFLTLGIGLGAFWAYYELGWGGWWFWDPVENASLMPWLIATALLHSAIVTQRGGALPAWTALLAILAFGLSIFGTFLTRSGIITSVHTFAVDPARGLILLGVLGVTLGGGLALFAMRAKHLSNARPSFTFESRETAILANNIFLVSIAGVVLLGTVWPLIIEATTGANAAVGAAYFESTAAPMLGVLLLLAPVAPFLTWRRANVRVALGRLWIAASLAISACVVTFGLLGGSALGPALAAGIGVWVFVGAGTDIAARLNVPGGRMSAVLAKLASRPWSLASPIAHAGIGLLIVGAAGDAAAPLERQALMAPGDRLSAGGREVLLEGLSRVSGPNYAADRAHLSMLAPGCAASADNADAGEPVDLAACVVARMTPERRYYPASDQSTTEVAIRHNLAGDFYVALGTPAEADDGSVRWTVRALFNPLTWMVFSGIVLMAAGAGMSLMRGRSGQKRGPT